MYLKWQKYFLVGLLTVVGLWKARLGAAVILPPLLCMASLAIFLVICIVLECLEVAQELKDITIGIMEPQGCIFVSNSCHSTAAWALCEIALVMDSVQETARTFRAFASYSCARIIQSAMGSACWVYAERTATVGIFHLGSVSSRGLVFPHSWRGMVSERPLPRGLVLRGARGEVCCYLGVTVV